MKQRPAMGITGLKRGKEKFGLPSFKFEQSRF